MKISFLVTYYNQEAYVRQSLDSILAVEKPGDWEILVGDDGSSDGTTEIVREYIERDPEHIRLYVMPRQAGATYDSVRRASANRLNLLAHCTGDCFCTLDGDDYYCDTKFAREAVDILRGHGEVSLVAFGFCYDRDGVTGEPHLLGQAEGPMDRRSFLRNLYIHAGACVHRRNPDAERLELLRKIGYFDDNNIVINSLHDGEMYNARRVIYAYRQRGGSMFNSMSVLEQAMLNVQGMDVDLKLAGEACRRDVFSRYAAHLDCVYLVRNHLREALGEKKYRKYLDGCALIGDSIGERLLRYPEAGAEERRQVRRLAHRVMRENPLRLLTAGMMYLRRGMKD